MDELNNPNDDLLGVANSHARDIEAACTDVAATIFPTAISRPTDVVLNAVSMKLMQIVGDLEARLLDKSTDIAVQPATWSLLVRSGFLREADLVDFALARVSEDRLDAALTTPTPGLPAALLDHPDGNVADAAQILLASDSLHRRSRGKSYLLLPPELLHKTCWRVVAGLEIIEGQRSQATNSAARQLLASYEEAEVAQVAAHKLVHFLEEQYHDKLLNPEYCGLHLFVAKLATELELDHDHVLRLLDCGSSAPFIVLMAAMRRPQHDAGALLMLLRGQAITSREAALFASGYEKLDPATARLQIAEWSLARANFLAFGNP